MVWVFWASYSQIKILLVFEYLFRIFAYKSCTSETVDLFVPKGNVE